MTRLRLTFLSGTPAVCGKRCVLLDEFCDRTYKQVSPFIATNGSAIPASRVGNANAPLVPKGTLARRHTRSDVPRLSTNPNPTAGITTGSSEWAWEMEDGIG